MYVFFSILNYNIVAILYIFIPTVYTLPTLSGIVLSGFMQLAKPEHLLVTFIIYITLPAELLFAGSFYLQVLHPELKSISPE
jgi:hypothetical protein